MALALYLAFLAATSLVALLDWRRAWLLIVVCGVLQDPVRKLTEGTPVVISFLVVIPYAAILFGAREELVPHAREFVRRFPAIATAGVIVMLFLGLAFVNGFFTFGLELWQLPLLSLFTYLAPIPAFLVGYAYLRREEMLYRFFTIYGVITSVALVGTALEYFRVRSAILGVVAFSHDYVRYLPGIQVRLLSGIYRSPDVMAWHAATLTTIAVVMALRTGFRMRGVVWMTVAAGGFLACMVSGRRKAVYYVVTFVLVFLWRYLPRFRGSQFVAIAVTLVLMAGIVNHLASSEESNVYARGAATSATEVMKRLEGGVRETVRQSGILGAGLGMATQGAHHLAGERSLGWQEGGLAKLAVELGVPGLLAVIILLFNIIRLLLKLTTIPDVPGSSQFSRAVLFALLAANVVNFLASAQSYTDAMLGLYTSFFAGCVFATAVLDERLAAPKPVTGQSALAPATA